MADQTVRVANLDNGTARVALELWQNLRGYLAEPTGDAEKIKGQLDFYAECRVAALGGRKIT